MRAGRLFPSLFAIISHEASSHGVRAMRISSSSAAATPSSSPAETLASCVLISHCIHAALANSPGLILHRSQWQCLACSYSEVLQALTRFLQPALGKHEAFLTTPLQALHEAMLAAERCLLDCIASSSTSPAPAFINHSWLLDKALKLGASTDVIDLHLHNFLWTFSTVLDVSLSITPQTDNLESDLLALTRKLSNIWACANAQDDLSSACSFLNAVRCKDEGDTSFLADFILQKLSHAQSLESVVPEVLPTYLWVDSGSLQRNPEMLGDGGYGKVYEAVWLGGRFAVKDFFYVENNIDFGREAAIQARLRHPNVIPLVCCSKKPSVHKCSLVMELMQKDLRVWMLERTEGGMSPPFSLGVAVDLMLQIAQGMEYLHSLHIMHRDLKSSNVLVSLSRKTCDSVTDVVCTIAHLKIADFGMSKAKHASSKFTTKRVGTTRWRAPEVFEMNTEDEMEDNIDVKYTKKADVYSFGLVCYEILTGKSPFEGAQVRRRVLAGERPMLPSYCPQALSSYIERCWNAEPSKRPPFSQICRVLRYLKAAVLFQDHHTGSPSHNSWLSQPLSHAVCARIDEIVRSFMQPWGSGFRPQPLNVPLEMYSCRVVLLSRLESESTSIEYTDSVETVTSNMGASFELNASLEDKISSTSKIQGWQGKFICKAKNRVFEWFEKLLCVQGCNHLAKTEFQDALGLVRDFTFNELQIATNHFSRLIGEGGNGKVYYGKLEDGREIAVKVANRPKTLQSGRLFSVRETKGLVQELRIASQLRHRNIVPLFGWCQARGNFYLVYEYMPHGNLASHIFGEQPCILALTWQQRYKISCQLASALKYLHQDSGCMQIVHRDVKANNVLLDSEWDARLGDCGLALLLRDGDSPSHTLAGTLGYIAPECVAHGKISAASDVYAFGVTILELVSGRRACSYDASSETYFLRDWVWELFQRGDLIKVADLRLRGDFEEMQLKRLLLLGLSCTSADPHLRPRTEEVLAILSGSSDPPPLGGQSMECSAPVSSKIKHFDESHSGTGSPSSFWSQTVPGNNSQIGALTPKLQQNANQRLFSYKELKVATKNFWYANILGEGSSGKVYRGRINEAGSDGTKVTTVVAVKVLHSESVQGYKEWLAEMFFLGQFQHPHLVRLIGFCSEDEHRILVYQFMPKGTLDNHLYGSREPLTWSIRVKIAIGAAKGLAFLHGAVQPVIFRDLKTSNILLDMDYTAKLSDLGLAKVWPAGDGTHVTTQVMGTSGYAAPEYVATGHLTWRSDVYSFGIVLLELVTGRRVIDKERPLKERNLVEWARSYLRNRRTLQQIVDPKLNGMYSAKGAYRAASLAFQCLDLDPKARPSMSSVVQTLEPLQTIEDKSLLPLDPK